MKFSERLKKLIKESDITMSAFAAQIGVTKQYLSDVINKERNISSEKFVTIFNFFDKYFNENNKKLNVCWFLNGSGNMFSEKNIEIDNNVMRVRVPKGTKLLVEYEE